MSKELHPKPGWGWRGLGVASIAGGAFVIIAPLTKEGIGGPKPRAARVTVIGLPPSECQRVSVVPWPICLRKAGEALVIIALLASERNVSVFGLAHITDKWLGHESQLVSVCHTMSGVAVTTLIIVTLLAAEAHFGP